MIIEINKDILDTDCDVIAHGVNCQGIMGSGVAKVLYQKWPENKFMYQDYCHTRHPDKLLGDILDVITKDNKVIINCFTQLNYGYDKQLYLSYEALEKCINKIKDWGYTQIAIPKIGCGLAGGDWEKVKEILNRVAPEITFKVYYK